MSDCDKNEVYPSKLAKMSEFRHIFSQATLWVDIAKQFSATTLDIIRAAFVRKDWIIKNFGVEPGLGAIIVDIEW